MISIEGWHIWAIVLAIAVVALVLFMTWTP